jgi:hypothetical protein
MSCERIAREVIDFFRFGELDARSAPHLDHLAVCVDCREEVGLDRELVIQLRRALMARLEGHAASPEAWLEIRRRALQPEMPTWRSRLLPVFRLAPVGAAFVLAIALLAPAGGFSPFRVAPGFTAIPLAQRYQETPVDDPVDPYEGHSWLRYVTAPPPSPPATRALAAADPGARQARAPQPVSGPAE